MMIHYAIQFSVSQTCQLFLLTIVVANKEMIKTLNDFKTFKFCFACWFVFVNYIQHQTVETFEAAKTNSMRDKLLQTPPPPNPLRANALTPHM